MMDIKDLVQINNAEVVLKRQLVSYIPQHLKVEALNYLSETR